jgi:hypothetical protein
MKLAASTFLAFVLSGCVEAHVPGRPVTDVRMAIKIGREACRAKAVATASKIYPRNEREDDWTAERKGRFWVVVHPIATFMDVEVDALDGKAGDCDIEYVL